MYKAAMQLAREASVEELLGNLIDAQKHYSNAKLLIEAVMITVSSCIHYVRTHSLTHIHPRRQRIRMIEEIYYFLLKNSILVKLFARNFSSRYCTVPHLSQPLERPRDKYIEMNG